MRCSRCDIGANGGADIDAHHVGLSTAPDAYATCHGGFAGFQYLAIRMRAEIGKRAAALSGHKACLTIAVEFETRRQTNARFSARQINRDRISAGMAETALGGEMEW